MRVTGLPGWWGLAPHLVGTEGTELRGGHPTGPTETPSCDTEKKAAWELLQGEMLSQHPPARPFKRQRQVVLNMPQGK